MAGAAMMPAATLATTLAPMLAPKPSDAAQVQIVRSAFMAQIDPQAWLPFGPEQTLADMAPADGGAWLCMVDAQCIPRALWHCAPPPGARVVFLAVPQGGGRGSNPLRTLLQLAAMVAISFIPFGPGLVGALLRVGATLVANALINNLVPLDQSNGAQAGGQQQYSAQAQGNLARIGQPVPELFGWDDGYPDLAAQPYSLYENNEQYLHVALCVGRGQHQILRISIGDTPIQSFGEATVIRVGPAQAAQSGPGTGVATFAAQTLVDVAMITSADVSQIELKSLDFAGPFPACPAERVCTSIGVDIALPRGLDEGRSVQWRVEAQLINDFEQPAGNWFVLGSHSYSTANPEPVRLSYEYAVDVGRYRARVVRTDFRTEEAGAAHDISWLALRAKLAASDIADTSENTYVVIKVRASGQLSGGLRFRVMVQRMLPMWTGSAWTAPQATRSPAWAMARILKARGVADAQIDLAGLLAFAQTCDARQDRFDYRFDASSTTWDALAIVLRVARAVPLVRASRYTLVRDAQQVAPVAAFTMRNIRRGTFRLSLGLPGPDPMRVLDLEYRDHRRSDWVTVTAQIHNGAVVVYRGDANRPVGVPAPDPLSRGRIKMPGIIGEQQAKRTAAYTLADGAFRRLRADIGAELDGLLPAPLSLTVLQHDVGNFGQGGDAVFWDVGTLTLTGSERLEWAPGGGAHYVRLVRASGAPTPAILCTPGAQPGEAVLDAASLAAAQAACDADGLGGLAISVDAGGRERTRYVFGPADNVHALAKVRAIRPTSEREVDLSLVIEDDRVHTADAAFLPQGNVVQDPVSDGSAVDADGGTIVNLTNYSLDSGVVTTVDMSVTLRSTGQMERDIWLIGPETLPYDWIVPRPISPAAAAGYQVRYSLTVSESGAEWGPLTTGGVALDVWHTLDADRTVTVNAAIGNWLVHLGVEVRDAATGAVLASCTYDYRSYFYAPGGGG
jgi:hypothetical protein